MSGAQERPVLPGQAIGVIGGGQLGRYLVFAARRLGYPCWVLDPDASAPAMQIADHALVAAYDDAEALATLARQCKAVTIEFENVPFEGLDTLAQQIVVSPPPAVVRIAQDRRLEKQEAVRFGLDTAPYAVIESSADIDASAAALTFPAILKTARLGYDGKGQVVCQSLDDVRDAFASVGEVACVLEQRIDLAAEVSVVLARGKDGAVQCFPVADNVHRNGILHTTRVPAGIDADLQTQALDLATRLADGLDYVGVLAVEFFVTGDGRLLFNEMAPRPHNSGHYTLDATDVCQFEQQLRALCRLPLIAPRLLSPVTMLNVLGDHWQPDDPDWLAVLAEPGARLHLYGKASARPGRKMGHINLLADGAEDSAAITARAEAVHRHL